MELNHTYEGIYSDFLALLDKDMAGAGNAGFAIVKLSACYATHNKRMHNAYLALVKVKADLAQKTDQATNKPYTSAKVEQVVEATPEFAAFNEAKTDVENIQVHLRSLANLQFGLKGEQSNS